ncbi:adhesion domain-containing protein [Vibrio navarrensis]
MILTISKSQKKYAQKATPVAICFLLMACGGESSSSSSQSPISPLDGLCAVGEENSKDCDGFCTYPEEGDSQDCGYGVNEGRGYGDGDGICEEGEYQTPDCDGLYVSPVEDGSIDSAGAALKGLTVSPTSFSVYQGVSAEVSATGIFANNQTKNLSGLVHWSSAAPSYVTVYDPQSQGYDASLESVTVEGRQTTETPISISANSNGQQAISAVMVEQGTLDENSLQVSLENDRIPLGFTGQAYVEFSFLETPDTQISSQYLNDSDYVTWSIEPEIEGVSVTSEGQIVTSLEAIEAIDQLLVVKATGVNDSILQGEVETRSFQLTNPNLDSGESTLTLERSEVYYGTNVQADMTFHFNDGQAYQTHSSDYVRWSVFPENMGVTISSEGLINTDSAPIGDTTYIITGQGQVGTLTEDESQTHNIVVHNDGTLEVPGIGLFYRTVKSSDANGTYPHVDPSHIELEEDWARFTHSQAQAMCNQRGYLLPTWEELVALRDSYQNLFSTLGWPKSLDYWSASSSSSGGHRSYNLNDGSGNTGYDSGDDMPYLAACIKKISL